MWTLSSIRARMTAAFTLAIALLMLSTCGALLWYARVRAESEKAAALRSAASDFVMQVGRGDRKAALAQMDQQDADLRSRGILLVLRDARGREIAEVGSHRHGARREAGERRLFVPVGADTAVFSLGWGEEAGILTRQAIALAVVAAVIVLAAGFGAWALVGRTLSPLRSLSRQARVASADTLSVQLRPPSEDAEMLELVSTLNGLLGRLSEAAAARGRFQAAASHELRTPLQALLGHLELGLSRRRSPEEYAAILNEARAQADRLIALTRDLLFLSRLESGAPEAPEERVDLAEVCDKAARLRADTAAALRLNVMTEGAETALVLAPPTHAEVMVRNLVDNAVKYTPPGGAVRIVPGANPPRVDVWNDVQTGTPLDTERLFEPFYRPDVARNSGTGGNGLGLAICAALAAANGWTLSLQHRGDVFHAAVVFASEPGAGLLPDGLRVYRDRDFNA